MTNGLTISFNYKKTRMLSQAINRAMPHGRNQLEQAINHKELIFYLAV